MELIIRMMIFRKISNIFWKSKRWVWFMKQNRGRKSHDTAPLSSVLFFWRIANSDPSGSKIPWIRDRIHKNSSLDLAISLNRDCRQKVCNNLATSAQCFFICNVLSRSFSLIFFIFMKFYYVGIWFNWKDWTGCGPIVVVVQYSQRCTIMFVLKIRILKLETWT